VVSLVPFVDLLILGGTLPCPSPWASSRSGYPQKKADYDYMKTYSPYDNLEKKAYPAILVRTSLNDSQVIVLGARQVRR